MFGAVLSQIKVRIKDAIAVAVRKAILVTAAVALLLCAAIFGLVAAYHGLISIYGFTSLESAGIVGASLVVIGLLTLALLPLVGRKPKPEELSLVTAPSVGLAMIDQGLSKATQQIGALPLVAVAFAAGLLISRR